MIATPGPKELEHLAGIAGPHELGTVTLTFESWPAVAARIGSHGSHGDDGDRDGDMLDERALSSVHVVAFVGDRCAVCRIDDDWWTMPGTTIAPGERWQHEAERTLRDDAGIRMWDVTPFGLLRCHVDGPPIPDTSWIVAWSEGEVATGDTNANTRTQAHAHVVNIDEAAELVATRWPLAGDLYRLAAQLRANACHAPSGNDLNRLDRLDRINP